MELRMTKEIAALVPQSIEFNYGELKSEITARLERYRNMVVTEDDIPGAKKDKAALNNLAEALNSQRITQQREYMRPFEAYKEKVDELIQLIREPVDVIDRQLKDYERIRREDKRAALTAFYEANSGEMSGLLAFDKIWNERWLNVTYKQEDAEKEITAAISKAKNDVAILRKMGVACEQQMIDKYLQTLDMSAALAEKTRFEELQKRLEAHKAAQKPAAKPETKPVLQRHFVSEDSPCEVVDIQVEDEEPTQLIKFWVKVTPAQKKLMREFLVSNEIEYGSVK